MKVLKRDEVDLKLHGRKLSQSCLEKPTISWNPSKLSDRCDIIEEKDIYRRYRLVRNML